MVTVIRRDKPENPNRQPRGPAGSDVAPPAPRGRFQRGVDMITNAFSNLDDKAADYFRASDAARTGGFTFSAPTDIGMSNIYFGKPTEYDADARRYLTNQLVLGSELGFDLIQLPFEALGQQLGFNVGSGQGYGDLDQILAMSPEFGGFRNPLFDEAYAQTVADTITDIRNKDLKTQTIDQLVLNPSYQNYLRGQGFSVPDGYNVDQFYEDIVNPRLAAEGVPIFDIIDSADDYKATRMNPELDTYLPMQGFETEQDYLDAIFKDYFEDVYAPAQNKILEELTSDYFSKNQQNAISNLAQKAGISENLASNLLLGTGKDIDAGLLTDLIQNVPEVGGGGIMDAMMSEYQTPEGETYFTDPIMQLFGFGFGSRPVARLFDSALRSSPIIRGSVGQMYPSTAGLGIYIPKKRLGSYRIGLSPMPRAIAQGLILADTEE